MKYLNKIERNRMKFNKIEQNMIKKRLSESLILHSKHLSIVSKRNSMKNIY